MSTSLIRRVKDHARGQATSGQNTLILVRDCLLHMQEHNNEWTPLAFLIGLSQPAQSRMVRQIAGCVLEGWTVSKDLKQKSGVRLSKEKGSNQGFDAEIVAALDGFISAKLSIQSQDVKDFFKPVKETPEKTHDEKVKAAVSALKRRLKNEGISWQEIVTGMVTEPSS